MASLTTSPQLIALVPAAMSAPTMLLSLVGGALADNTDRRRIMLVCHFFMLATVIALVIFALSGAITPWLLLAFTFLSSTGSALNNPARHAFVREIVPRQILGRAVAFNSTSINLAKTVGPAIGGAIVTLFGVATAFIVNAVSFIGVIIVAFRWRPEVVESSAPKEALIHSMTAGVRYALRSMHTRIAMLRGAVSGFAAGAVISLLPVVARQELEGTAFLFGLLLGAYGVGAVVGAIHGGRLRETCSMEAVSRFATITIAAGLLLLGAGRFATIAALGSALAGMGWVLSHSSLMTAVQLSSPDWISARALALYTTATHGALVAGNIVFGALAEATSAYMAYLASGAFVIVAGVLMLPLKMPDEEAIDQDT